jgi:hypothetical protein
VDAEDQGRQHVPYPQSNARWGMGVLHAYALNQSTSLGHGSEVRITTPWNTIMTDTSKSFPDALMNRDLAPNPRPLFDLHHPPVPSTQLHLPHRLRPPNWIYKCDVQPADKHKSGTKVTKSALLRNRDVPAETTTKAACGTALMLWRTSKRGGGLGIHSRTSRMEKLYTHSETSKTENIHLHFKRLR